jgi:ATP-dependent exoDNAse (exonuclease V) alpha subunit
MNILKKSQQINYDNIINSVAKGEKRIVLKGSAGTGKTILVSHLVNYYLEKFGRWDTSKVFVTAPTNKALSILQQKIKAHKNLTFSTVHSALKLQRNINSKTGVVKYVPGFTKGKEPPFLNCKIAFVDECSMLNSDLIMYLDKFNFPIIFIGDDKQLNPVGELDTPIFNRVYPEFELTEIIRQGAGNPIIDLSRDLDLIWFKQEKLVEEKGYIYNNEKESIISNLAEVNGTDDLKYLAWTNAEVDSMNNFVREKIYTKPNKIELRETLVFKEPFGDFWTNQEIVVKSLDVVTKNFNIPNHKTKFEKGVWINPSYHQFKVYMINGYVPVIHEDSDQDFLEMKRDISANCRSKNWDWKGYYYFLEQFANMTYNHAISTHKSQGSTYKEAIINVGNLNLNKNAEEKQRLFYTAVTRASDLLILSNVT